MVLLNAVLEAAHMNTWAHLLSLPLNTYVYISHQVIYFDLFNILLQKNVANSVQHTKHGISWFDNQVSSTYIMSIIIHISS